MFAIACSLLALVISIIAVWLSGRPKVVFDQEKLQRALSKQYFISQLEKAGRNPPAPTNFQKPAPTPAPPPKRYQTGNPILNDNPWDSNHPCHDVHLGETEYRERFQPPPKKP